MYDWVDNKGYISNEFRKGVEEFSEFAILQDYFLSDNKIRCPCLRCDNKKFLLLDEVTVHLYLRGFPGAYTIWVAHGEPFSTNWDVGESSRSNDEVLNPCRQMVI